MRSFQFALIFSFGVLTACGADEPDGSSSDNAPPAETQPKSPGENPGEDPGSWATESDIRGNGGDVVTCFNSQATRDSVKSILLQNRHSPHPINPFEDPVVLGDVRSLEILDLYEYRLPTGFPPVRRELLDMGSTTFTDYFPQIIAKTRTKSRLGHALDDAFDTIPFANWTESPGVVAIDDSDHSHLLPRDCLLVQIAVRRDSTIYYDGNLFNQLDELGRLALVTHELVYKIGADLGQTNSRDARKVVGLLLSKSEFDNATSFEIYNHLKDFGKFGFPFSVGGHSLWIKEVIDTHTDGSLASARIEASQPVEIDGQFWEVQAVNQGYSFRLNQDGSIEQLVATWDRENYQVLTPALVNFSDDRELISMLRDGDRKIRVGEKIFHHVDFFRLEGKFVANLDVDSPNWVRDGDSDYTIVGDIEFHPETAQIASTQIYGGSTGTAQTRYGALSLKGGIEFFPDGTLKSCTRCTNTEFSLPENSVRVRLSEADVFFREDHTVERVIWHRWASSYADLSWTKGHAYEVERVEFDAENRPVSIKFLNRNGKINYDSDGDSSREYITVGQVTLELDTDGQIINLP